MITPMELVDSSLQWPRQNYRRFPFVVERDIVWTLQQHINSRITSNNLPYTVFSDYPMLPGKRRSLCADLVILDAKGSVAVALEFKYEPSHNRRDLLKRKFPVVFWGKDGVGKDLSRIRQYVEGGKSKTAVSIFIDEGGLFANREPHPGSRWIDWDDGVRILYGRVDRET